MNLQFSPKKHYLLILTTISIAIVALGGLLYFSPPMPNEVNNGFNRKWMSSIAKPIREHHTNIQMRTIAEVTENHIFYSTNNPKCLIKQDLYEMSKIDSIYFPIKDFLELNAGNQFNIDSPWVFLFINNLPALVYGKMNDSMVFNPNVVPINQIFTKSVMISPSSAVIRTFPDSTQSKQVLQKIDCSSKQVIAQNELIPHQREKGFADDGTLVYDNTTNKLVYLQFYQNTFFVLDTNLLTLNTFHTIDTVAFNKIELKQAKIDGVEKLVPAKARITVNQKACVNNGKLYVMSGLRADNEKLIDFNRNIVLDIYSIFNGKYEGSMYIPDINGHKSQNYLVKNDTCYVIYNDRTVIYSLRDIFKMKN